LNQDYQCSSSVSIAPYMAQPIEVVGQPFVFKPIPTDTSAPDYHQPWSGFVPANMMGSQGHDQDFPIQTANIKKQNIYTGIEVEGDNWMQMVCDAAKSSVEKQGGPFGALILQIDDSTSQVLRYWINYNQVTSTNDPTAHAEIMAIRSACASLGVFNLGCIKQNAKLPQTGETSHCVIYSSAEPCPMCYSAICWAKLPMLLFAATRFDAAVQGVYFSDEAIYEELSQPYHERLRRIYQCTVDNSLDAFNLWKRSEKIPY
jgi:guanine deaminase